MLGACNYCRNFHSKAVETELCAKRVPRVNPKKGVFESLWQHNSSGEGKMRIEDYEFEEEKTLSNLADLFEEIARQLREADCLELPMPSLREGKIEVPLGEPVETGIEVGIRKHFVHVKLALAWSKPEVKGGASD